MNEVRTFQLTIINQTRAIFCLILLPIIIITSAIIASIINFFFLFIFILSCFLLSYLLYYYSVGNLTVISNNNSLIFNWKRKYIFNYKNIDPINISEIKTVVIEEGRFLRKIITENQVISISTSNVKPKDSFKLIAFFNNLSKEYDFELVNSYKSLQKQSSGKYTKAMYLINNLIIVIAIILIIIVTIQKGFNPKILFLLGPIFMLISYRQKMKNDLNKK